MTVKDLVGRYEAQTSSPSSSGGSPRNIPPPTRARFIHPLLRPITTSQVVPLQVNELGGLGQGESSDPTVPNQPQSRVAEPSRRSEAVAGSSPSNIPGHSSLQPVRGVKRQSLPPPTTSGPSSTKDPVRVRHTSIDSGSLSRKRPRGSSPPPPRSLDQDSLAQLHESGFEQPYEQSSLQVVTSDPTLPSFPPDLRHDFKERTFSYVPSTLRLMTTNNSRYQPIHPYPSIRSMTSIGSSAPSSTKYSETLYNSADPPIPLRPLTRSALLPLQPSSSPPSPISTLVPSHKTIHRHQTPRFVPHIPVPASKVFARKALPLFLPALDEHISTIPAPVFTPSNHSPKSNKGKGRATQSLFPPMELLNGQRLEDLLRNKRIIPVWRDRNIILAGLVDAVLGFTGSSALANFYSLQGIYDTVQIFALLLSSIVPHSGRDVSDYWRKVFLGTIPNILALNIPSTLTQSLIFLVFFMTICALLLYYFHLSTASYSPDIVREGLQSQERGGGWGLILVTTVLTILYLPLSTIAVHSLVWSADFWVVPNPYAPGSIFPPDPLGPTVDWRNPLDFCYTTTMNKSELNWAPIIVILSALTFLFMTIWFPIRLTQAIRLSLPKVDPYTELGKRRSKADMENEYRRMLQRDTNPFAFLYSDFRRTWGSYKAIYLWAKLSTLLIIAFLDPDNCVFRSLPRDQIANIRQIILVVSMLVWFLLQCFLAPFVDPVNNASEWTSRANYLATALVGLGVSMNVPGKEILEGPILYIIYVVTYGLTFYFAIINMSWTHRLVKKLSRRIDFSIDMFSPNLDITPFSPHAKRRIWQETISALLLASNDCKMPVGQKMQFADSRDSEWPPYLLGFQGTPGERHAENLKILRDVGWLAYARGIALTTGPEAGRLAQVQAAIQRHFVGPDSFWEPTSDEATTPSGRGKFFGNAWWTPFPPTLTIRYDSGKVAVIQQLDELEEYVSQNEDYEVRRKRRIRFALRALDGQVVHWPYTHVELVGARAPWFAGRQYKVQSTVHYEACVFEIKRKGLLSWYDLQLGSGFQVQLTYDRHVRLDGDVIELDDDFELTAALAKFLLLNRELIEARTTHFERVLEDYRDHLRKETRSKAQTLTYRFLSDIYNHPASPEDTVKVVEKEEQDLRVRAVLLGREDAFRAGSERMEIVTSSDVATWWYLLWDDLWRRNHDTIASLRLYATDFDPHYPTSIAYRPLPRPALEAFLIQRGMFATQPRWGDFIHTGFLNKIYFRLHQIVFHDTDKEIYVHVGDGKAEVDLEDIGLGSELRGTSTQGEGGGTDHDDESIRFRPAYRWEAIYDDPIHKGKWKKRTRWTGKFGVWFGITPLVNTKMRTNGVSLDVTVEGGKYVAVERLDREPDDKTSIALHKHLDV